MIDTKTEAHDLGWTPMELKREIIGAGKETKKLQDGAEIQLKATKNLEELEAFVFLATKRCVDHAYTVWRWVITIMLASALVLLIAVNVLKAKHVISSLHPESGSEVTMTIVNMQLTVGDPVVIEHEDGSGGSKTIEGKLISENNGGNYVLELDDGTTVVIPRGRVFEARQSAQNIER